jgi:hypothetical protein
MATTLRQTDFLPNRFSGDTISRDQCTAHILTFEDYLDAHDYDHTDHAQLPTILKVFKRSLQGQARLWIDNKTYTTYMDLKAAFISRFSGTKSKYAHVQEFNAITMESNESAEIYLQRIRQAAMRIGYGEAQIRDKFLSTLPTKCRTAILLSLPDTADSEQIASRAQCYLDLDVDTSSQREVTFSAQTDEINKLREEIAAIKVETSRNDRSRSHERHSRSPGRRWSSRSTSSDRRKRNDNQFSRNQDSYRSNSRSRYKPKPRIICDYCLIPGHKWRDCRKRKRELEDRKGQATDNAQNPNKQDF